MTEPLRTVPVGPGDTLSRIATREGYTLREILAVNQQIRNPNKLSVGQHITLPPPKKFQLTVRFVNSWNVPPVARCAGIPAIVPRTIASPVSPPSRYVSVLESAGTYGGCATMQSNRSPSIA